MINTSCENCVFSKISSEECLFDIPNTIKNNKVIYKKNNANYIENYVCRYTLSDKIYNELISAEQTNETILEHIIAKVKIKYYLVINLDPDIEKIKGLCDLINRLEVTPQFVSFINKNLDDGNNMADKIQENISKNIQWKLHNFIVDINLQECMTICMDTNFNKTSANLFCVYDHTINGNDYDLLNERIKFLHISMIVKQMPCYAIVNTISNLDGLAMGFDTYKFLIHNRCRNILEAIETESQAESNFNYILYDFNT